MPMQGARNWWDQPELNLSEVAQQLFRGVSDRAHWAVDAWARLKKHAAEGDHRAKLLVERVDAIANVATDIAVRSAIAGCSGFTSGCGCASCLSRKGCARPDCHCPPGTVGCPGAPTIGGHGLPAENTPGIIFGGRR